MPAEDIVFLSVGTALYSAVLYCTVVHCAVLYGTVVHCTALHCTALYNIVQCATFLGHRLVEVKGANCQGMNRW